MNKKLQTQNITADLHLVGGAVMCLVLEARKTTVDIDAYFVPTTKVRDIAHEIAHEENLPTSWLNDGVKGFFSGEGSFSVFLELSHLKIYTATPEYLLAMKCLSMRIGEEFFDIKDVSYLLRYLNIETIDKALDIITAFYPKEKFPTKSIYVLQDLLEA